MHRCYYCKQKCQGATATVQHCVEQHPDQEICLLRPYISQDGRVKYLALHYNKTISEVECSAKDILTDKEYIGHFSGESVCCSPAKKVQKPCTPYKDVSDLRPDSTGNPDAQQKLFTEIEGEIEQMTHLLPYVTKHQHDNGQLDVSPLLWVLSSTKIKTKS